MIARYVTHVLFITNYVKYITYNNTYTKYLYTLLVMRCPRKARYEETA